MKLYLYQPLTIRFANLPTCPIIALEFRNSFNVVRHKQPFSLTLNNIHHILLIRRLREQSLSEEAKNQ
jgi:hypothetical protein